MRTLLTWEMLQNLVKCSSTVSLWTLCLPVADLFVDKNCQIFTTVFNVIIFFSMELQDVLPSLVLRVPKKKQPYTVKCPFKVSLASMNVSAKTLENLEWRKFVHNLVWGNWNGTISDGESLNPGTLNGGSAVYARWCYKGS